MSDFSYSEGMILFLLICLAAYGLWCAIHDENDDEIIDRTRKIADARAHQEAQWIAAGCWYGPKKDPIRQARDIAEEDEQQARDERNQWHS